MGERNLGFEKSTGDTNAYLVNPALALGLYLYTKNADTSNIKFSAAFYSNYAYGHMWEDVEKPDCLPGGWRIYYNGSGKVYKFGGYSLSGECRNVPNHEFAYKDSVTHTWNTIYTSAINSELLFGCFIPNPDSFNGGRIFILGMSLNLILAMFLRLQMSRRGLTLLQLLLPKWYKPIAPPISKEA